MLDVHVAICGGTGPAGGGLARRLAAAGHTVTIGSRDHDRAKSAVASLGIEGLLAAENDEACKAGEIIVFAVPWEGAEALARKNATLLAGKVVISMANAVVFIDGRPQPIFPQSGSVALAVQLAAPQARVVAALHHVPAHDLGAGEFADVLVCADDRDARHVVADLLAGLDGLTAVEAGDLGLSSAVEAFTAVLLSVNRIHKGRARIKILGLGDRPS
jgi:NADPH-dependent F420 reductase